MHRLTAYDREMFIVAHGNQIRGWSCFTAERVGHSTGTPINWPSVSQRHLDLSDKDLESQCLLNESSFHYNCAIARLSYQMPGFTAKSATPIYNGCPLLLRKSALRGSLKPSLLPLAAKLQLLAINANDSCYTLGQLAELSDEPGVSNQMRQCMKPFNYDSMHTSIGFYAAKPVVLLLWLLLLGCVVFVNVRNENIHPR